MEYTIDGNILTMIMPFTEHNFNTYSEENFKKMGIPATVSIITNDESITKMLGGTFSPDELTNDSNYKTMTIPYKSFYMRMKYLTNMFDNKIDDNKREGLFMRTFKEIPVVVNNGFQKIKHILDDINAPKIQRDEVEFHPVVVNDVYDVLVKDDNDKKLFENKPIQIIETPQMQPGMKIREKNEEVSDFLTNDVVRKTESFVEPTTEQVEPTTEPVEPTTEHVEPTTEPVEPTDSPIINKSEKKIKCVCIGEEKWCKIESIHNMYEAERYKRERVKCVEGGGEVMLCSVGRCVYYVGEINNVEGAQTKEGFIAESFGVLLSELSKELLRDRRICRVKTFI